MRDKVVVLKYVKGKAREVAALEYERAVAALAFLDYYGRGEYDIAYPNNGRLVSFSYDKKDDSAYRFLMGEYQRRVQPLKAVQKLAKLYS